MTPRKMTLWLLCILSFASARSIEKTELIFLKNGELLKTTSLESLHQLQKDEVLKVFEPHENTQKMYKGFSVLLLMDKIYGKTLSSSLDTLVFYCTDGYRSDVPIEEFKKKKATLSFAMADGSPFVLKNKTPIALGPFYLTWDHPSADSAKKEFFRWPYGINKMDFIESANAYRPLLPPINSDESIKTGHREFLKHCFSCHSFNGVGGLRGPPLNYFVQSLSPQNLSNIILDPKSVNPNSQMSGLPISLKNRKQVAADIVRYLKKQQK